MCPLKSSYKVTILCTLKNVVKYFYWALYVVRIPNLGLVLEKVMGSVWKNWTQQTDASTNFCQFVCVSGFKASVCPSFCLSVCLCVQYKSCILFPFPNCLSGCLCVLKSSCLSVRMFMCPLIWLFVCPDVCVSAKILLWNNGCAAAYLLTLPLTCGFSDTKREVMPGEARLSASLMKNSLPCVAQSACPGRPFSAKILDSSSDWNYWIFFSIEILVRFYNNISCLSTLG